MQFIKQQFKKALPATLDLILGNDKLRKFAVHRSQKFVYKRMVEQNDYYTWNIRYERHIIVVNLINTIERALTNKNISPSVRKKLLKVFISRLMLRNEEGAKEKFMEEFGFDPPKFVTISPGKRCNLHCIGCYAGSGASTTEKLDYETVDRIVTEKTKLWDGFFTVISGGEPLMWKSEGKGILDLCREHQDNYFMMYTNGTLIRKDIARQMAELGNITPAISVEGFEGATDARRGKGVYKKILEAMANLREAGVPFGISVTATRNNVEEILSDEFVDFFFNEQGAVYGWVFQYMPIGRHQSLELMVTPEQRKWMFEREKYFIHEKNIFLPDFWNSGAFSCGCVAGGRPGGYIYIEWNGNVTPCVFYPYSKNNIKDIYAAGGNLNDALKSDLMVAIRKWQRDYGFRKRGHEVKNMIAPCGIRDHYEFTHKLLIDTGAKPIDPDAAEALKDPLYYKGMVEYDKEFEALTKDMWQNDYISEATRMMPSGNGHNGKYSGNGKAHSEEVVKEVSLTAKE